MEPADVPGNLLVSAPEPIDLIMALPHSNEIRATQPRWSARRVRAVTSGGSGAPQPQLSENGPVADSGGWQQNKAAPASVPNSQVRAASV
jgi:hypothetical protein